MLDELALKYGTDKGSTDHNYCPFYEKYLPARGTKIALLELGVWHGASLQMWQEYYPRSLIIGLDHHAKSLGIPGIITVLAEQDDATQLGLLTEMYDEFDVIIDDASHISSKTITSFKLLYPHLKPGGLYVIEDLQTSYDVAHYGVNEAKDNPGVTGTHTWTAMEFCKRLADEVNSSLFPRQHRLGYDVAAVHFHPNICFIKKT